MKASNIPTYALQHFEMKLKNYFTTKWAGLTLVDHQVTYKPLYCLPLSAGQGKIRLKSSGST